MPLWVYQKGTMSSRFLDKTISNTNKIIAKTYEKRNLESGKLKEDKIAGLT